jgi:hypothetical protein
MMKPWVALVLTACSVPAATFTPGGGGDDAGVGMLDTPATDYDFGTVVTGTVSATAAFTFTNGGTGTMAELQPATLSGPTAVLFGLGADGCQGRSLAPGESCTVAAHMAPSSAGVGAATLIVGTASTSASIALSGTAVTPGALVLSPTMKTFAGVGPGVTTTAAQFTAINTGGSPTGTITVTLAGSDATQFAITDSQCAASLGAGESCTITTTFSPSSAGDKAASLVASSTAAGTGVAALGGHGLAPALLTITPATDSFGSVVVGNASADATFTIANAGELAAAADVQMSLAGGDAGQYQVMVNGCLNKTLAGGESCMVAAVFAPTSPGTKADAQLVATAGGLSASAALGGTGLAPADLVFSPASNNFGTVDVGTASAAVAFTLTNTGDVDAPSLATSLIGTNAADFTSASACGATLAAGATCVVTIGFAPGSFGNKSATLQATASTGGTTVASLSGTGRDKVTLTVATNGGTGTGTVTSSPGPLACSNSICTTTQFRGTSVTLTETPDSSMVFGGWSGACAGTATTCTVTLAANTNVTASFQPSTKNLTWTTPGVAGATGTLTTSPAGTSCGTNCLQFATGTAVKLTAAPSAGSYLHAWSGDCVGNGLTCNLVMNVAHGVSLAFSPANLSFITSGSYWPDPANPFSWANATCQASAQAAGLPGTFVGLLGSIQDWQAALGAANGWVRVDGKPHATTSTSLAGFHTLYPNVIDEHGVSVAMTTPVLSGYDAADTCNNWQTTTSGGLVPGMAGGSWAAGRYDYTQVACGTQMRLVCAGIDYDVNLTYAHAAGRTEFVTYPTTSGGGVAALDAACASDATASGIPGTFRALVATTSASAASRVSAAGAPWIRADGIPIVASAGDLFNPSGPALIAALGITASQIAIAADPFTGATDLNSVATGSNCSNFTSTANADLSTIGEASMPNAQLFNWSLIPCSSSASVLCLQQ